MENYDIFRLNNFLIYKKTGTDGLSIYDWNKKKFAFKNENSEQELLKINDIYINDRNSDIELIDLVEREQENSFSSVVNYYSDMSEVQLHKKTILYLIKDKDFDMLQDLFDKIEDDQSYSYLYVYAIKKLIQYGNSPSLLKGKIQLTEENQEIVTTLSISMISDVLLKYFDYFKKFFIFTPNYVFTIDVRTYILMNYMTKFIAKWREFLYKYSKVDDKESTFKLINDYVIMLSQSLDNDNYSIEMEKEIISETKKYLNEEDYTNVFKNLSSIHDSYYFILFVEELIKHDKDKTFEKVWEIYRKKLKSTYKDKKYMNIVMEIKSFEVRNDDLYQYLKKNIEKTFKKRTKLLEILKFVDTLDFQ